MPLLTLTNVRHAYGNHVILDGVTLSIEPGEKVGLVGRNGSGKTSLMRMILGAIEPQGGTRQLQRGTRVGYLNQDPAFEPGDTVRDAAERAFAQLHDLHVQIADVYDRLASATDSELDALLRRQARLESEIEAAGGYTIDHRINAMLHGLVFDDAQFGIDVASLSGGQKGRLGLARLLLEEPDLLLLDEPTNHLDLSARQWLETFLAEEYPGAVLVVSHDRWLLDRVVHRIVEIEQGVLRDYPGNYHAYVALRQERQLTQQRVRDKQLDKIRQEEQFIARYKAGQRAKQARGRATRLERFKRDALVEAAPEQSVMRLALPPAPRSGELVIVAESIAKQYGETVLFRDFDLTVMRGERIGFIGPNGVGKTTLLRVLLGEIPPDAGTVRLGSRLSVGYYQQLHENVDRTLCVWEYLQSVAVGMDGAAKLNEQQARDLAGAFLFSGREQDKRLSSLSGGERSRLVLAGLVASAKNVLVLDEPSNHLDIPSAERLEFALSPAGGYEGTLLLVSHDRALLEATCDRLIVFDGSPTPRAFPGRYSDWARRSAETAAAPAAPPPRPEPKREPRPAPAPVRRGDRDPLARLPLAELESRIEAAEGRIRELDAALADAQVYANADRVREAVAAREGFARELAQLETEWSRRAEAT
jgi:ATP-binding cassette subfamily F protein 3